MQRQSTVHQPTNTSSSPGSESSSQWNRQLFFFLFCRCDRNVKDAALSFYHFYLHWVFEPEDLTLDEFIEWFFVYENPEADVLHFNADQMRHLGKDTLAKDLFRDRLSSSQLVSAQKGRERSVAALRRPESRSQEMHQTHIGFHQLGRRRYGSARSGRETGSVI